MAGNTTAATRTAIPYDWLRSAELATCPHRHQLLASVVEADRTRPLPAVTLYHCCHEHPLSTATVPVQTMTVALAPDALEVVQGFADLDTVCLPAGVDVAAALLAGMEALAEDAAAPDDRDDDDGDDDDERPAAAHDQLARLVRQLPAVSAADGEHEGGAAPTTFLQFFALTIYSDSADDAFSGTAEGRPRRIWRWAKPTSPYQPLGGWWRAEMHQALEDGAWRGGRELMLLVHGVSADARHAMVDRMGGVMLADDDDGDGDDDVGENSEDSEDDCPTPT